MATDVTSRGLSVLFIEETGSISMYTVYLKVRKQQMMISAKDDRYNAVKFLHI